MAIKNVQCEGQVTSMTTNWRLTDEQVLSEIEKYTDRVAVAVYRSETATVIVAQLLPMDDLQTGKRKSLKDFYPKEPVESTDGGWPEG